VIGGATGGGGAQSDGGGGADVQQEGGGGGGGRRRLGWAGFRRATGSGTCEWAGRAGVRTFSISSSPITFGGLMGKNHHK
jgi:hypothetical protein